MTNVVSETQSNWHGALLNHNGSSAAMHRYIILKSSGCMCETSFTVQLSVACPAPNEGALHGLD